MKLAISNIAWPLEQDPAIAELLVRLGVRGIEIAPTKVWRQPEEVDDASLIRYRRSWNDRGIDIVAAQALLFGHPELTLFDNAETRRQAIEYLGKIIRLCGRLGCESLVFGSPRNRRIGGQSQTTIWPIAVDVFSQLGAFAAAEGTCVVLEANPAHYGADFVTHAAEAIDLVRAVNHPGFRLHLDTACMTMASDPIAEVINLGGDVLRHFHVSEFDLQPIGAGSVDHSVYAAALRTHGYQNWISIEMRESQPFMPDALAAAIQFTKMTYEKSAAVT